MRAFHIVGIPVNRFGDTVTIKAAGIRIVVLLLACALTFCVGRFAVHSQPLAEPLAISELAADVFMHTGALALMTRENEGAIANVGSLSGAMASP